jgi:hypothetical protein
MARPVHKGCDVTNQEHETMSTKTFKTIAINPNKGTCHMQNHLDSESPLTQISSSDLASITGGADGIGVALLPDPKLGRTGLSKAPRKAPSSTPSSYPTCTGGAQPHLERTSVTSGGRTITAEQFDCVE